MERQLRDFEITLALYKKATAKAPPESADFLKAATDLMKVSAELGLFVVNTPNEQDLSNADIATITKHFQDFADSISDEVKKTVPDAELVKNTLEQFQQTLTRARASRQRITL